MFTRFYAHTPQILLLWAQYWWQGKQAAWVQHDLLWPYNQGSLISTTLMKGGGTGLEHTEFSKQKSATPPLQTKLYTPDCREGFEWQPTKRTIPDILDVSRNCTQYWPPYSEIGTNIWVHVQLTNNREAIIVVNVIMTCKHQQVSSRNGWHTRRHQCDVIKTPNLCSGFAYSISSLRRHHRHCKCEACR